MNDTTSTHTPTPIAAPRPALNRDGARLFIGILIFTALQVAILLAVAGTARWPAAWAYFGIYALSYLAGLAWVARVNPAVINERGRRSANTADFDRRFHRLMPLIMLGGLVVGGLDHRFGWSNVPVAAQVLGLALLVPALWLAVWVLASNAWAARVVRLQEGQRVASGGPYRYVRHPMYTGTILALVAAALALGSWWMLLVSAAGIALFVWRTRREDDLLLAQLDGYRDYAQATKARLFPGVW